MEWTRSEQAAAEARGCKLHCTSDTKTTIFNRKSSLGPCRVTIAEIDVDNITNR